MSRIKVIRIRRSGFVLALAIFVMVVLMIIGAGLLSLGYDSRVYATRTADAIVARSAADSGLTKALWEMNRRLQTGWSDTDLPHERNTSLPLFGAPFSATYSYRVGKAGYYRWLYHSGWLPEEYQDMLEYILVTNPSDHSYIVRSIGKYRYATKRIIATVQLRGRAGQGVIARERIILKSDTLVDGFNSNDPTDLDVPLEIGTLSILPDQVILNNGIVVDGSIVIGVGGDVDTVIKDLGATTGPRYPMQEEIEIVVAERPTHLLNKPNINVHGEAITLTPADSGQYNKIELKRSTEPSILTVSGGDVELYVTGDIWMGQECEIKIEKGSTLTLFIDGDIRSGGKSGFNNEGKPTDLTIWGTADVKQSMDLNAKSEYFGQVYAPNSDILMRAKGDLYGAFTANSFEIKAGGNLFYDGALREVDTDDECVYFAIQRWSGY